MDTEELTSRNIQRTSPSAHSKGESERFGALTNQRWLAIGFGAGLLLGASLRRNAPIALAGGVLLYRGATGRRGFSRLFGRSDTGKLPSTSVPHETGIKVERSIVIHKPVQDLYDFWRHLENLPRFMSHVIEVNQRDAKHSHWKIKSLAGTTIAWDAEIINEIPNELIAWRSLEGSEIDHAGSVHFETEPPGATRVRIVLEYRPPAGRLGAGLARMFGQNPAQLIEQDLGRLKQLLEVGESPSLQGSSTGGFSDGF